MINAIRGKINSINEDSVYIETYGIEWKILLSSFFIEKIKNMESLEQVYIVTYLHIFEGGQIIYGFANEEEREVFLLLNKVQGLGPKQAMKIISFMSYKDVVFNISSGNEGAFTSISGVGKKTAGKIIVTLVGDKKMNIMESDSSTEHYSSSALKEDITNSLVAMGYDRKKVITILRKILKEPVDNENSLIKRCIIELSK